MIDRSKQLSKWLALMSVPLIAACADLGDSYNLYYGCEDKNIAPIGSENCHSVELKYYIDLDELYRKLKTNNAYTLNPRYSYRSGTLYVTRIVNGVTYNIIFDYMPETDMTAVNFNLYDFEGSKGKSRLKAAPCATPSYSLKRDAGKVIREMGLNDNQTKELLALIEVYSESRLRLPMF